MNLIVTYEFNEPKHNIHEFDDAVIPISKRIIFNEETLPSINRFILGLIGLKYGCFVVGTPSIKNIKITE